MKDFEKYETVTVLKADLFSLMNVVQDKALEINLIKRELESVLNQITVADSNNTKRWSLLKTMAKALDKD